MLPRQSVSFGRAERRSRRVKAEHEKFLLDDVAYRDAGLRPERSAGAAGAIDYARTGSG